MLPYHLIRVRLNVNPHISYEDLIKPSQQSCRKHNGNRDAHLTEQKESINPRSLNVSTEIPMKKAKAQVQVRKQMTKALMDEQSPAEATAPCPPTPLPDSHV